jgi:hypothetical protein
MVDKEIPTIYRQQHEQHEENMWCTVNELIMKDLEWDFLEKHHQAVARRASWMSSQCCQEIPPGKNHKWRRTTAHQRLVDLIQVTDIIYYWTAEHLAIEFLLPCINLNIAAIARLREAFALASHGMVPKLLCVKLMSKCHSFLNC